MYTSTVEALNKAGRHTLLTFKESATLLLPSLGRNIWPEHCRLGIFHGSPSDPDEFLFANTPDKRFQELATEMGCQVVITGHSHSPYYKFLSGIHFINPGSAGRMFDGDPRASCAILEISEERFKVQHLRISYDINEVVTAIRRQQLPEIYATMFLEGKKLN